MKDILMYITVILCTIFLCGCYNTGGTAKGSIYASCVGKMPHSPTENLTDVAVLGNYTENPNNPDITKTIVSYSIKNLKHIGLQPNNKFIFVDAPNKSIHSIDKINSISKTYLPSRIKSIAAARSGVYQEVIIEFKFGKPYTFTYDSSHPVYGMISSGGVSTVTSTSSLNYNGYNPYSIYQPSVTTTGTVDTPAQYGAVGYVASKSQATAYPFILCVTAHTMKGDDIRIIMNTVALNNNYKSVIPPLVNELFKYWGKNTPTPVRINVPLN